MTKKKAAYLGSFDPLTLGHLDIIERASQLFDTLIIGVGNHSTKTTFLCEKDRLHLIKKTCQHLKNIEVYTFKKLAVEFAISQNVSVLIRGLRTEADFVYEMQMAMMNRTLCKKLETVFIPTKQSLSHVSSTLVKEVASLGGDISKLVPPEINAKILNTFSAKI